MNRPSDSAAPLQERRRWFSMRSLRARLVLTGLLLQAVVLGTFYAVAAVGLGEALEPLRTQFLWFGALLLLVSALTSYVIVSRLTRNVRRMTDAAIALERGALDARSGVNSHDEVGSFAATFDRMADSIQKLVGEAREQDRRLAMVQDASVAGIWDWDIASNYVYFSPQFMRLLGYHDEAEFRAAFMFSTTLHPEDRERMVRLQRDYLARKVARFDAEYRVRRRDGGYLWVHALGIAQWSVDTGSPDAEIRTGGAAVRFTGSMSDVTARREAEQKVRALHDEQRAIFDNLLAGIVRLGDRRITVCNPRYAEILGYTVDELIGKPVTALYPDAEQAAAAGALFYGELARNGTAQAEFRFRRKDGTIAWFLASGTALDRADPQRDSLWVVLDIGDRKRAETALRENEARFYHALRGSRDAIWDWDLVADRYYMSPRMREMLGYGFSEPITVRSWFLGHVHEDDLARLEQTVRRHLQSREPYELDYRLRAQGGGVRWTRERGRAVYDADGRPVRFSGANSDITAEREALDARRRAELELKSAKEFSEALLAAQPGVFCVLDKAGRLLRWNRNLETVTGYHTRELAAIGTRIVAPADQEEMDAAVYRVFKLGAATVEASLLTRSGRHIPQLWTAARWEAGGETYLVASAVDISEIRALTQQLELRVAERTAELTRANRELESFSYTVSHDLSGPLRAINGFATLLVEELGGSLRPDAEHFLERLVAGSVQMQALIDDLLRLAQVSRNPLVSGEVDLAALARRVAADCAQQYAPRSVSFECAEPLVAHGDASLLRIALANLIGNAWKFTARRDGAEIGFGALERDGERVYFLRDNGAGFDMQYAAKLFEPFQRLHDARDFPGTGIGLAIVHRIVERHGGRIWVESAPGVGTTFYFTLGA